MANPRLSVPENLPGEFFVDSTCIDCDACRQIAPATFAAGTATSYVQRQPVDAAARRSALHALLACPTGSIGCRGAEAATEFAADFPLPIDGPVFYCGYNSPKSFGGNSYFLLRPDGNWLVDSPRFVRPLVSRLEALGGVSTIFLTHQDDVADAAAFARHFGARRVIHAADRDAQPDAECVLDGDRPRELAPGCVAIPTPGHTAGHCCLLVDDRYLFTGDHLAWDRDARHLIAFPDYCWDSWERQTASMRRLLEFPFEWALPGHGQRVWLPADEMRRQLADLAAAM